MTGRRAFLIGLGTLAGTAAVTADWFRHSNHQIQVVDDQKRNFTVVGDACLRDRAAAKGLIYGAASHERTLSTDADFATCFARECGILVTEGELKWRTLRPTQDRFNFAPGDLMAKFARTHGMLFRGHTLVWHQSLPRWFADTVNSKNAEQIFIDHIKTVVGHYAGKIHSWDVVNEAIQLSNHRSDGLRKTPWLKFLGPSYIDLAFHTAAAADPQALLVYNENRLHSDDFEARRAAVLRLLERLKSNGTPVHALGMQGHMGRRSWNESQARNLRNFLRDVASLGLKILVTEMDVNDKHLPLDISVRDRIIAGIYEDYLSIVLDEPAVIAVLTWGLSDQYTWRSKFSPRRDGAPVRPLPLDVQLRRKLAWNAIARAFDRAPLRAQDKAKGTLI